MENLNLRKAVHAALGRKWDEWRCRICGWQLKESIEDGCTVESCSLRPAPEKRADEPPPYELKHHLALDALMEFCEKNGYHWEISLMRNKRYNCTIWKLDPGQYAQLVSDSFYNSLAICICEAIVEASQKSEKKEAGDE